MKKKITSTYDQSVAMAQAEKMALMAIDEPRLIKVSRQLTKVVSHTVLTGTPVLLSRWYQIHENGTPRSLEKDHRVLEMAQTATAPQNHRTTKHSDRYARVDVVTHAERVHHVQDPAKERGHCQSQRNGNRGGVASVGHLLGHSRGGVVAGHDPRDVQETKQERPSVLGPAGVVDHLREGEFSGVDLWTLDQHGDDQSNHRADVDETVVLCDSGQDGRRQRVDDSVRGDHRNGSPGDVAVCRHIGVIGSHRDGLQQQGSSTEIGRASAGNHSNQVQPSVDPTNKRHPLLRNNMGDHIAAGPPEIRGYRNVMATVPIRPEMDKANEKVDKNE
ncbi:hypothetical protein OGAPHI_006600 [Ogataea philodendri]|uniref:Uncharacterized protein n=1 Tax=Ogataea philodendri TaxID=1378263 RepID=A0A9P8NVR8_9ASCO|nr:uncharacterized protein OGAPHI_006600 [Ogataea philodendri]KAH3661193.1 hypothetical protein OGAPHI_006600 [Ogataea philodendri]